MNYILTEQHGKKIAVILNGNVSINEGFEGDHANMLLQNLVIVGSPKLNLLLLFT